MRHVDALLPTRVEQMTPLDKVFMLEMNDQLDFPTISRIFKEGFSRIPVFDRLKDDGRGDVVGLLLTKDLILIDPDESISVRNMMQFFGRGVHTLREEDTLGKVLQKFKTGYLNGVGHLAVIRARHETKTPSGAKFYELKGIVTLEDIIEEILQDEIIDETDQFIHIERQDKVHRRDFDFSQMKLFDTRLGEHRLDDDQINAAAAHLILNVETFAHGRRNDGVVGLGRVRERGEENG